MSSRISEDGSFNVSTTDGFLYEFSMAGTISNYNETVLSQELTDMVQALHREIHGDDAHLSVDDAQ